MHKLHFHDTMVYVGNVSIELTNELNPIFPFPTTLLGPSELGKALFMWRFGGYISIYISLVHVCCVCRVLEDTAARFALCPGIPPQ